MRVGASPGPALGFVEIDGLRHNVTPMAGTVGIDLVNVQHATLRNLWMREGGQGEGRAHGVPVWLLLPQGGRRLG